MAAAPDYMQGAVPVEQPAVGGSADYMAGAVPVDGVEGQDAARDARMQAYEQQQEQYGGLGQQALTALEGVGEGVAGPAFTAAERASGLTTPEAMLGRREANPSIHGISQGVGLVGSSLTGLGEGALLSKAGAGAAKLLGMAEPVGALAKIGAGGVRAATEMALFQGGDEASKALMDDPNASFQNAIANVGLAAAIGAGGGAALGAINPLWSAAGGKRLNQFLEDFKGRVSTRLQGLEPGAAVAPGIEAAEAPAVEAAAKPKYDPFKKEFIPAQAGEVAALEKAMPKDVVALEPEKLSPGAKAADFMVDKAMQKMAGKGLGATVGGLAGSVVGHKWLGALIGERALGPLFDTILPTIIKPILQSATDGGALKSAVDYAMAVSRGEKIVATAAKNIFKPGAEVLASSLVPNERDRNKLIAHIDDLKKNPEKMINHDDKFAYYLQAHGAAKGTTMATAIQYLDSIKPKAHKFSVLDKEIEPSPHQKAEYHKALDLAQQPALVFKKIKDGTITSRDIGQVRTMYPDFYRSASMKISHELADHVGKDGTVPYHVRIGIAKFLDMPLDSTMQSMGLASIQQSLASDTGVGMSPGQMAGNKIQALQKSGNQMQTPQQASQARKQGPI